VSRFDLVDFLEKTGFSLRKLATYLQVAPGYLEAARAGETRLTARDQAACRLLWRRLFKGRQLDLPFAEPLETFTRNHARTLARARAAETGVSANARPVRRARSPRASTARGAAAPQQPQEAKEASKRYPSTEAVRTDRSAYPGLADPV
jgi:hypothetical protein